ncbi:MAG TPA: FG-GAP repeat protein, partial [Nitrososphaera sp.]|nr:FG-GAP repeat protein [Nitrososphaera sp.]
MVDLSQLWSYDIRAYSAIGAVITALIILAAPFANMASAVSLVTEVNVAESGGAAGTAGVVSSTASQANGDFDGDGFDDLAIGVPFENVGTVADSGAVNVLYGGAAGISSAGDQFWTQNSAGIENSADPGDVFGWTVAAGDFDSDGFDDLAIGIPGEDVGGELVAGAVAVIYGTSSGLSSAGDQFWTQGNAEIEGDEDAFDNFGRSLAVGDFDGDGFDDLAIGVPFETVGTVEDGGAVNVLYGGNSGLSGNGDQLWTQDSAGVNDAAEDSDFFGTALTAGDFDNDGKDDLAIGVPMEDIG